MAKYGIYRKRTTDSEFVSIGRIDQMEGEGPIGFLDNGLEGLATYCYALTTFDQDRNESELSDIECTGSKEFPPFLISPESNAIVTSNAPTFEFLSMRRDFTYQIDVSKEDSDMGADSRVWSAILKPENMVQVWGNDCFEDQSYMLRKYAIRYGSVAPAPMPLEQDATYYWRVSEIDPASSYVWPSNTFKFSVQAPSVQAGQ